MNNLEILKKYKLTKKEHETYYEELRNSYIKGKKPVKKPVAVIVGGQAGAGKSGLLEYSKKLFKDSNFIIINGDEIRFFHPKCDEIARLYPELYIEITSQDTNLWTRKLFAELRQKKFNLIFEGTMRNNIIANDGITELQKLGYIVIVRGLAVSYLESMTSILERYESQISQKGWGKLITLNQHNEGYIGMPETINYIEQQNKYDILEIFARGQRLEEPINIYTRYDVDKKEDIIKVINEKEDIFRYETISKFESAKEAVLKTREIESDKIRQTINKRIVAVLKSMNKRKVTPKEKQILLDMLTFNHTIQKKKFSKK